MTDQPNCPVNHYCAVCDSEIALSSGHEARASCPYLKVRCASCAAAGLLKPGQITGEQFWQHMNTPEFTKWAIMVPRPEHVVFDVQ